ncbi:hypothetical protein Esti_001922 [Eimeria stiedai]
MLLAANSCLGPPVLANITAHLNLQDYDKEADSTRQNSEDSTLPSPRSEEAEASDHENRSDDVEDTQETSNDAEGGDKGGGKKQEKQSVPPAFSSRLRNPHAECRREEKVLEEAEEKIARAQEELNKEEIREEVAEAAELEKRADLISQTESEEAEEEQIAEEV